MSVALQSCSHSVRLREHGTSPGLASEAPLPGGLDRRRFFFEEGLTSPGAAPWAGAPDFLGILLLVFFVEPGDPAGGAGPVIVDWWASCCPSITPDISSFPTGRTRSNRTAVDIYS